MRIINAQVNLPHQWQPSWRSGLHNSTRDRPPSQTKTTPEKNKQHKQKLLMLQSFTKYCSTIVVTSEKVCVTQKAYRRGAVCCLRLFCLLPVVIVLRVFQAHFQYPQRPITRRYLLQIPVFSVFSVLYFCRFPFGPEIVIFLCQTIELPVNTQQN
ncbi:uncharacterized protein ASCRUDRAFT_105654 [Ascoidea rubescens DSM 1968]|uniref:Transmembrane protein n=1 Tax=Ascoidea rubescens DSM 1968 TaxID=1344418 RepID=A0A1D2VSA3_9ASCO|nr:hypothetical protein ASCRUDRAFT_105654 [Ascoidea rubescens DSM 1968]ODV64481.1 hypothetical protein ASCRUDRAFT_105654 [Ascoidea rubescens DSM 1968]